MLHADVGGESAGLIIPDDQLRTRTLLRELSAFANRNPRFARHEISRFNMTFHEDDDLFMVQLPFETYDPEEEMEREHAGLDADDINPGKVSVRYEFSAEWIMIYNQYFRGYSFGVHAEVTELNMPQHIAASVYKGKPGPEAVLACGPSTFHKALSFNITTADRQLGMCDGRQYFDGDGDLVSSVCSCDRPDNHDPVYILPHDHDEEDDDGAYDVMLEDRIIQCMPVDALRKLESEKLSFPPTPDEALKAWIELTGVNKLDPANDSMWHDQALRLGLGTLRRLDQLLMQMSGVERA